MSRAGCWEERGVDLSSFQRQKEMSQREIKKKMIVQFVIDNEVNYEYIKRAHMVYHFSFFYCNINI